MPIRKTTQYICDGCGKKVEHWTDSHHVVTIDAYNLKLKTPVPDKYLHHTYVYCNECTKAMWKGILSARGGEHDVTD